MDRKISYGEIEKSNIKLKSVKVKRDYTLNSNTKSKIISGFLHFRSMHRIEILM